MRKVLYSGSGKEASFVTGWCNFATKVVMKTRCNGFTCDIQIVLKTKSEFFFSTKFSFLKLEATALEEDTFCQG